MTRTAREVVELYHLVVWNQRDLALAGELLGERVIRHGVGEAVVYQSPTRLRDGLETTVGSMEIFRVVDGSITEVWNCGYEQGVWA